MPVTMRILPTHYSDNLRQSATIAPITRIASERVACEPINIHNRPPDEICTPAPRCIAIRTCNRWPIRYVEYLMRRPQPPPPTLPAGLAVVATIPCCWLSWQLEPVAVRTSALSSISKTISFLPFWVAFNLYYCPIINIQVRMIRKLFSRVKLLA